MLQVTRLLCSALLLATAYAFSNKNTIQPVPLQDVQLQHDSQFDKAVSLNREYLLGIDSDRLLKTFRMNAGLEAPGETFAGSWEDPGCEVRGQFMGHWLSGTAMLGKNTGDEEILNKSSHIIQELRKVQEALGKGYLSAFPFEHFERLRKLQGVWAPFYVIHKIMAGLLDHYTFLGDELALQMVIDEAGFFLGYIEDVVVHEGRSHWNAMLNTEYGGMEETLFLLHSITKEEKWATMATYFTHPDFFGPLVNDVDVLPGQHANTHLAQVNGFAAGFETTGDKNRLIAVSNFFDIVTSAHSYATGGNNDGEFWQQPHELAPSIAPIGGGHNTEETCTTYNMLKIARYLFRWSGDARYADYYEKALLNGMLGVQRMPSDYSSSTSFDSLSDEPTGKRRLLQDHPHSHSHGPFGHDHDHHHDLGGLNALSVSEPRLFTSRVVTNTTGGMTTDQLRSLNWRQLAFEEFDSSKSLPEWSNAPGPGVIIYLLPLGTGNDKDDSIHHWSTPLNSFWCCSGSIAESFGKLMDSIYFQREVKGASPELYVNQYVPSSLHWRMGGLNMTLNATLTSPDLVARAIITFKPLEKAADAAEEVMLKLRIPSWTVTEGASVILNDGESVARDSDLQPGSFLAIKRAFVSGDKIKMELPMQVRTERIDDYRPRYDNLRAIMVGPLLMAALTNGDRSIQADPHKIGELLQNVTTAGLVTLSAGNNGTVLHAHNGSVTLQPRSSCLPATDCTFRMLRKSSKGGNITFEPISEQIPGVEIVLESMTHPGVFLTQNATGALLMEFRPIQSSQRWIVPPAATEVQEFKLIPVTSQKPVELVPDGRAKSDAAEPEFSAFTLEAPLGSYPTGSLVVQGDDRSYVIAPLGNIIEEKYSPYLLFDEALTEEKKGWLRKHISTADACCV